MRSKNVVRFVLSGALLAFAAIGIARQNPQPQGPPAQAPPNQGMMGGGMMGSGRGPQGMMNGGVMGQGMAQMMGQMAAHHTQMVELMNKLNQSMAAIEKEKNLAALKDQLAAHRALLEQMRSLMTRQGAMMQGAQRFAANCPFLESTAPPNSE